MGQTLSAVLRVSIRPFSGTVPALKLGRIFTDYQEKLWKLRMNAPRKGRRENRLTVVCTCFELKTVADCVLYCQYLVPPARWDTTMVSKASALTSSTPVGSQCYKFLYFCSSVFWIIRSARCSCSKTYPPCHDATHNIQQQKGEAACSGTPSCPHWRYWFSMTKGIMHDRGCFLLCSIMSNSLHPPSFGFHQRSFVHPQKRSPEKFKRAGLKNDPQINE